MAPRTPKKVWPGEERKRFRAIYLASGYIGAKCEQRDTADSKAADLLEAYKGIIDLIETVPD